MRKLRASRPAREAERAFVVEGTRAIRDALESGTELEGLYVRPSDVDPGLVQLARRAAVPVFDLKPGVLEKISGTSSPQPALAVARFNDTTLGALGEIRLGVVCKDVGDPGNLGAVMRSAHASGADALVCCDRTVDAFNPKTVRASAGSIFHVPLVVGCSAAQVLAWLGSRGVARVAAVSRGGKPHTEVDLRGPVAFVVGNEATGLPEDLSSLLDGEVTIDMPGGAESLNVAMAVTVLCFEVARQRSSSNSPAGRGPTPYSGRDGGLALGSAS